MDPLEAFTEAPFEHDGIERRVYRAGEGPAVIVMPEIPGITPAVAGFAEIVADAGFTAFVPSLFGTPGRPPSLPYGAAQIVRSCISREFSVLSRHQASPITDWLRALARHVHAELGGRGVGAIGMCLTGNFALAMVLEPCLMAPVLSQPSLPFPVTRAHRAALHLSPQGLDALKQRTQEGLCVLGLRFTEDPLSPPERFETLRRELGDAFEEIEIPSGTVPDAAGPLGPHSVLTEDLIDEEGHPTRAARERVLAFLRQQLLP